MDYTWVKNLNRLLYDQSKHREKKHFCERCLHGYSREDLLEAHKPDCQGISLRFEQSPWMEPYIRMNTELRKQATSDFEKDIYKLMNNSVLGKTMENLRRRVNVKFVRSHEEDKLRCLIASPSFARANIFDDDLAAVQMHKSRLVLNRPIYVEMSVLDLS